MASPAEIVRRWDARKAREEAAKKAKQVSANDNADQPDDYIMIGEERVGVWYGPDGPPVKSTMGKRDTA